VNETLNDLREDMAKRYEAAITQVCAMETKVKEVINAYGVSTSQYVPISTSAAALQLSRQQNISGESFAMAAQVLLDKWAARGCDPKVWPRFGRTSSTSPAEVAAESDTEPQMDTDGHGLILKSEFARRD